MGDWRSTSAIFLLSIGSTLACAQSDTPPPARPTTPQQMLTGLRGRFQDFLKESRELEESRQGGWLVMQAGARLGEQSAGLGVDFRVWLPADPSMTSADFVRSMTQATKNLNDLVDRQCEIYAAAFKSKCQIARVQFDSDFAQPAGAQPTADAHVYVEFDVAPRSAVK